MKAQPFDQYAEAYDRWFMDNENVLRSEVLLLRHFLRDPGTALSVGCGSGLFEYLLRTEHSIVVDFGVEPSESMAEIARKRGMTVRRGVAENVPYEDDRFDTVILNGVPSYVADLEPVFGEAIRVLKPGGHILVADVPAESSYGLLYSLAGQRGSWDDSLLRDVAPRYPYPLQFAASAHWRTTPEKAGHLQRAGFEVLAYAQTLTRHPLYSNDAVEDPVPGFDCGDYVAIHARKP
jgi:SAM-dependent methyltransferase